PTARRRGAAGRRARTGREAHIRRTDGGGESSARAGGTTMSRRRRRGHETGLRPVSRRRGSPRQEGRNALRWSAAAACDRAGAGRGSGSAAPRRAFARPRATRGRPGLPGARRHPRAGPRDPARRATCTTHGCIRRSLACLVQRAVAPDPRARVGRRHRRARQRLSRMTVAVLGIDWQTLADAVGLGAIYALMAVGIGLVFGVLRLVNFAYGQLVMAGAYALAFASERGWPVSIGIVLCFAVVLTLSALMDRVVFRPLRGQSPAVMLVATFAVAFLLQSIALLWFGPLGKISASLATLNQPVTIS